jgi:hypothetical protein
LPLRTRIPGNRIKNAYTSLIIKLLRILRKTLLFWHLIEKS